MNKIIKILLVTSLIGQSAFGACDFKTGITPLPDGTYVYSRDCHIAVGQMKQDLSNANKSIADLNRAITLKDLAIADSDKRAQLWMTTSNNLEDRITKIDSLQSKNDFLYFGLGIFSAVAAGFMAAKLLHP